MELKHPIKNHLQETIGAASNLSECDASSVTTLPKGILNEWMVPKVMGICFISVLEMVYGK